MVYANFQAIIKLTDLFRAYPYLNEYMETMVATSLEQNCVFHFEEEDAQAMAVLKQQRPNADAKVGKFDSSMWETHFGWK